MNFDNLPLVNTGSWITWQCPWKRELAEISHNACEFGKTKDTELAKQDKLPLHCQTEKAPSGGCGIFIAQQP